MTKRNPHLGSSFESWLDEEGIREEVRAAAIEVDEIAAKVRKRGIKGRNEAVRLIREDRER